MEEQNEWVFFKDIDWECPKNNQFNVDTRDFHVGYRWNDAHKDYDTLKKYPHFFLIKDELVELLEKYYTDSNGKQSWRFFALENYGNSWELKYLRIFRTELGYIVCDCDKKALKKDILNQKVKQDV